MKKIFIMILAVCFAAVLMAGCGEKKEEPQEETTIANDAALQGTWTEDYFDSGYTFNADGTGMDRFWNLSFTYTAHDGVLTIVYDDETYAKDSFQYTVGESSITLTRKSNNKSYTYQKTGG